MNKKMEYFYTALISILVFASLMQPTNGIYHKISLIICVLLIGIFILSKNSILTLTIQNKKIVFFFMLYSVLAVIAAFLIPDVAVLKYNLQFLLMFISIALIFNHLVKDKAIKIVLNGALIAYVPFLILCFKENHIIYNAFAGVYKNPNMMGLAMLGLVIVTLMKLYNSIVLNINENNSLVTRLLLLFYGAIYLFSIYVIMSSNARTSLISTFVGAIVIFVCVFLSNRSSIRSILKIAGIFLAGAIILIATINYVPAMNEVSSSVVTKGEMKTSANKDTLDGRPAIWKYVIDDMNLWGHGKGSLEVIGMEHAHNAFFNILRDTGLLTMISYFLFIITLLGMTIRNVIQNRINETTVFTLIIISVFIVANTFESTAFHITNLLLFLASGFKLLDSSSKSLKVEVKK